MSSNRRKADEVRQFKGTTVFEWDHEPSILRDTGFEVSTVPTAWNASRLDPPTLRVRREHEHARRQGVVRLVIVLLVVIAASAALLYEIARMVRA